MGKSYSHINRIKNTGKRQKRRINGMVNQMVKDVATFLPIGIVISATNKVLGDKE